jgi:peptidoglycan-N-acetylglucosamine deacetylase
LVGRIFIVLGLVWVFGDNQLHAASLYSLNAKGVLESPALPPKTVVLTFDDGPSSYTPQIIKILKDKGIRATFFVIGQEALKHRLLQQMYADGFEIGNHTFSHIDLSKLPPWRVQLELNMSRLIIESQINHGTRLFRLPYLGSDTLSAQSQNFITQISRSGYLVAGEDIDSEDWRKPGISQIIQNSTAADAGGIILMHDGGGDRSQTVSALPGVIDYYQQRGYRFATISEALGLSRDQLMPPMSRGDAVLSSLAARVFATYGLAKAALYWVIIFLIIASFGRMALVIMAALIQSRRKFVNPPAQDVPCSIVVPAYNESAVIQSCLKSILASDYRAFEVIVVDDGSKDNTRELASGIRDPRLQVISKTNGGKASALNHGIDIARANFVVAIDADTVFKPNTLRQLMRHFQDPKVGAVSGNTRIANRHKLLTKLQSLEYVVGFNLDRRMGDLFDCITVVPGAIGAFRKTALKEIGGFSYDTLAEDTDITLSIKEKGHRIIYDASAVAYTEAPSTIEDLLKQRFRWSFGTMQSVWKHRRAILNPRYGALGLMGLPYLLFYQILFPLFGPFFDAAVIVGLFSHQYGRMLVSFAVYTIADCIMSGVALRLDGEKLRNLWLIVPQRIIYRQLMYYVIAKSVVNVLKGNLVGWGSLKREGKHLKKA